MDRTEVETHEPVQSPGATLADELYSHREQAPAEALEREVKEETTEREPVDDQKEEQTDVREEVDAEEGQEESEEESSETQDENDDEVEVTTLEQLADHLETDPDWLRGLKVTEKVNGKEVEVSLSDALRTHRQVAAGDDYLADAKSKAKDLIEESTQQKEMIVAAGVTIGALLSEAEKAVTGGMSQEELAKLRRDDPAEWTARQKEMQDKLNHINQLKQQAGETFKNAGQKVKEQEQARRQAELPKEREVFFNLVPEWKDPDVQKKEANEISEYLKNQGLNESEIETIAFKGVYLAMARAAMMHEKSKGKISAAKKKVVKIPKVMKPGKPAEDSKSKGKGDDPVSILYG